MAPCVVHTLQLLNVCFLSGDGKTHYIRKELKQLNKPGLVIAVNESFTPLNAILKLRKLPQDCTCAIFFNFTIVPSLVRLLVLLLMMKMLVPYALQYKTIIQFCA